jgi:hypothetical protein
MTGQRRIRVPVVKRRRPRTDVSAEPVSLQPSSASVSKALRDVEGLLEDMAAILRDRPAA